jgi:TIR domain
MSHDAFISYSSRDKATADATCAALEASGVRCWIAPRDITPGIEWGEAIIDGINQSRVLILIFSANANESPQIRREIERAVGKGIPIIPFRIQDIAPTRSLEYFIGAVHWLDALTPPLQIHLRRLVDTVKALLQIDPTPPPIVSSSIAPGSPVAWTRSNRRRVFGAALTCLGLAAIGVWWSVASMAPRAVSSLSVPTTIPTAPQVSKASVDPVLTGTFERDSVIDGYNSRFIYSIAADGTYRLVIIQDEAGTYQAANGQYRTVANITGRVRTGTYRAIDSTAIEVRSATGTAIFRPTQPTAPIDQGRPVMLGVWRATAVQDGLLWTLTIQNNPDGTYHYSGRTEDSGTCVAAEQHWRTLSAVTGQSNSGTYRIVDARDVEIMGANGSTLWQRQ